MSTEPLNACLFIFQSVKGSKPFKVKKKRGGRFGLKRLKEKRREELVVEGTPPRLEMSDVDVEFSLPKFKPSRNVKVEAGGAEGAAAAGKAKRRIRLAMFVFLQCLLFMLKLSSVPAVLNKQHVKIF